MNNVVVIIGKLARPPEARELPSGARIVAYEVTVERTGQRSETVPVVWLEAPVHADDHTTDQAVMVVGRVRRRFFRTSGGTQSRTEIVAEVVAGLDDRAQTAAAIRAAQAQLAAIPALMGRCPVCHHPVTQVPEGRFGAGLFECSEGARQACDRFFRADELATA